MRKGQDLIALAALMTMLTVAGILAMIRIEVSQQPIDPSLNPSPLGYTFSLALWVLPCLVFGIWLLRSRQTAEQRRAALITLLVYISIGFILDLIFGRMFLRFPDLDATLGILIPGYDLRSGWSGLLGPGWKPFIPLEEFAFYTFGFVTILLSYIWGDEILFGPHKVDDGQRIPRIFHDWKATMLFYLLVCVTLFFISFLIRRSVPSETGRAFPGYFLFILIVSVIPSLFCSRVAFQFINWRALTFTWLFVLSISQFWEASLGVPYGWWGFEKDQMMGIFLKPYCDLPIEEVLVWTLSSWTIVIIYETILTAIHTGRTSWHLFAVVRADDKELDGVKRKYKEEGRGVTPKNETTHSRISEGKNSKP